MQVQYTKTNYIFIYQLKALENKLLTPFKIT